MIWDVLFIVLCLAVGAIVFNLINCLVQWLWDKW